jgi:hypothetical protein
MPRPRPSTSTSGTVSGTKAALAIGSMLVGIIGLMTIYIPNYTGIKRVEIDRSKLPNVRGTRGGSVWSNMDKQIKNTEDSSDKEKE